MLPPLPGGTLELHITMMLTQNVRNHAIRAVAALSIAALFVASTGPAAEAAVTDYRAEAVGGGILLDLFGQGSIEGATSRAIVVGSGAAAAQGVGLNLIEGSISEVDITSGSSRVPETGDNCATPALPAPLDNLGVGLACSNAFAEAGVTNNALGAGFLGDVDLDGALLSGLIDFLVDALLSDVTVALDEALVPLTEALGPLVSPVTTPLAEQCAAGLENLVDPASQIFDLLGGIVDMDPTGVLGPALGDLIDGLDAVVGTLPEACSSLINILSDLPSLNELVLDLADALRAALGDLDLVQLTLGSTTSDVEATATEVISKSTAVGARLELPSLGAVIDAIELLVPDLISALIGQVDDNLAESLGDLLPPVTDLLDDVLSAIMLPDLLDATDPLLVLDAGLATATSTLNRAAGTVESVGTANTVVITLSSAFATLLGEDNTTISIPGGTTQSFGDGTPLASTISVVDSNEVTRDVDGITLTGIKSGGVQLDLFQSDELMGGISLSLATAEAVTGGIEGTTPAPAPSPTPPAPAPSPTPPPAAPNAPPALPLTGGGLALLGMLAMGGSLAMARRRD